MITSSVKNIILDLGNVILDFNPDRIVSNYTNSVADINAIVNAVFNSQIWKDYDKGTASEDDVFNYATNNLKPSLFNTTKDIINNWYKYFILIPGAEDFINNTLIKGFNIYLLSNVSQKYYVFKSEFPILSKLKGELISADEKLAKPDPKIFEVMLNKFNLSASECFFVDDNINNVNAAISKGINSFQFKGDYKELYKHLVYNGIFSN